MVQMTLPTAKHNNPEKTADNGMSVEMKRGIGARGSFVNAGRE